MRLKDMSLIQKFKLYLISSFLYYVLNDQVISNDIFDAICKELYEKWDEFDHPHKKLVNKMDLATVTGMSIKYPLVVRMAAHNLREEVNKGLISLQTDI